MNRCKNREARDHREDYDPALEMMPPDRTGAKQQDQAQDKKGTSDPILVKPGQPRFAHDSGMQGAKSYS